MRKIGRIYGIQHDDDDNCYNLFIYQRIDFLRLIYLHRISFNVVEEDLVSLVNEITNSLKLNSFKKSAFITTQVKSLNAKQGLFYLKDALCETLP